MKTHAAILLLLFTTLLAGADPPFGGTVFASPNIITDEDPTSFVRLEKAGKGQRTMWDRRPRKFVKYEAHLFIAHFDDGSRVEVQVNPEFSEEEALETAKRYLPTVGQIPAALREGLKTIWMHRGDHSFGGGNQNFLIHTDRGDDWIKKGYLAEAFLHEGIHTSLDGKHRRNPKWLEAQKKDPGFISKYAKANPKGEDLAESFPLYFALRYKPDRISDEMKSQIMEIMPNRVAYLDSIELDLHPVRKSGPKGENKKDGGNGEGGEKKTP